MQISLCYHRNLFYIVISLLNVFKIRMKIVLKKVPPMKILMLASKQPANVSTNVDDEEIFLNYNKVLTVII